MVRFPRKRSVSQPHLESNTDDATTRHIDPPTIHRHTRGDIPSDVGTIHDPDPLSRCDVSSVDDHSRSSSRSTSSSIGSSSTTVNRPRRRRFRVPMPPFQLRHPHHPPPLSVSDSHSRPASIISPKQRSHLQLLPWRNHDAARRGMLRGSKHSTKVEKTRPNVMVDPPSQPSLRMITPPIHTNFDTSSIHIEETSISENGSLISNQIECQRLRISSSSSTTTTTTTLVSNENIVPITPESVLDHLSRWFVQQTDINKQYVHQPHGFGTASAVVVVTPRNIPIDQMAVIVTPDRLDSSTNHPQQPNSDLQHVDNSDVVEQTKSTNSNIEDMIRKSNSNNIHSREAKHHRLFMEFERTSTTDQDIPTRTSLPTLLQENHCLKLSHLYTTIPNLTSNPWMTGCSL